MKISRLICALAAVAFSICAFAGEGARPTPILLNAGEGARATAILPKQFGGWQVSGTVHTSTDPAVADSANAALLQEYGFTDFASATYTRDDGRKLTIKAARFADASGAYGAFTYYKLPQMLTEEIGDQGASLNERVLFYRGNLLVDAVFARLNAMSAAELRELAGDLPLPPGNALNLPTFLDYLPKPGYVENTKKYVTGPIGLEKISAPLPAQLVDFNAGAEVVVGIYDASGGKATLILISYPTPQIAAEHLRRIEVARQSAISTQRSGLPMVGAGPVTADPVVAGPIFTGPIFDKRTGPIVVVATGSLSQSEAQSLLAAVNYEADVTWNENTYFTKKDNLANLLVNVIILCGILIGLAAVAGVAFGGLRILVQRIFPEKIFDRPERVEFISLHLSEAGDEATDSKVSSSIKAV